MLMPVMWVEDDEGEVHVCMLKNSNSAGEGEKFNSEKRKEERRERERPGMSQMMVYQNDWSDLFCFSFAWILSLFSLFTFINIQNISIIIMIIGGLHYPLSTSWSDDDDRISWN